MEMNTHTHTLPAEAEENSLTEYTITIKYLPKLKCKENELVSEFNSLWPIVTKKWLTFKDSIPSSNRIRRFWMHIVEEHYIEYPNLSDLVLILFSISPGTGPLERSFSPLAKICYKDRGNTAAENLETLYLLKTLKIEHNNQWFSETRELLQKKGYVMNQAK